MRPRLWTGFSKRLDAQQAALNAKVDRIVAAVEERVTRSTKLSPSTGTARQLEKRVAELERANTELKAQAVRMGRKTLVSAGHGVIEQELSGSWGQTGLRPH